jgi:hypothetical protein
MIRTIAMLSVVACLLSTTAVDARRSANLPMHPQAPPSTGNPCALRSSFASLHETIVQLSDEADDVGEAALSLRHRSISRAYKRIEEVWSDMKRRAGPGLDMLAYVPIALDAVPSHDPRKVAALELTASYRNALERFIDYTHYAVLYERSENTLSMDKRSLTQSFNFGVSSSSVRSDDDTYTRGMLDANVTEVRDAMRGILYPEYRYEKFCKAFFVPARRQAANRRSPRLLD